MDANFGSVKLKTDLKDASVYVDGGFADKITKVKKFALRPGNHDIEVHATQRVTIFKAVNKYRNLKRWFDGEGWTYFVGPGPMY